MPEKFRVCFEVGECEMTPSEGELLVQTAGDFSGVVWADVNLNIADNQWVTRQNHLFESRGPELYDDLWKTK
jgi:hypothetical protein